jgi:hypothetical protein
MWTLKSAQSYAIRAIIDEKDTSPEGKGQIKHLQLGQVTVTANGTPFVGKSENMTVDGKSGFTFVPVDGKSENMTTLYNKKERHVGLLKDPRLGGRDRLWTVDANKVHKIYLCNNMLDVQAKKKQQALADLEENRRNKAAEVEEEQERLVMEQQNMKSNANALKAEVNTMAARHNEEMHMQRSALKEEARIRSEAEKFFKDENILLKEELKLATDTLISNHAQDIQGKMFLRRQLLAEYCREQKKVKTRFTFSKKPRVRLVPCEPTKKNLVDGNGKMIVKKCSKAFIKRITAVDPALQPSETDYVWAYETFDGNGKHVAMADGTFGSLTGADVVDEDYASAGTVDNIALMKRLSERKTPGATSFSAGSFL